MSSPFEGLVGLHEKQLADGTVIWTLPSGHIYVTSPGSAMLFPALTVPTGDLPEASPTPDIRCGERTAMMPTRRRTRKQDRSQRITAERNKNRNDRLTRQRASTMPAHHRMNRRRSDEKSMFHAEGRSH